MKEKLLIIFLLLSNAQVNAEPQIFVRNYIYHASEIDSKVSSRRIAIEEVKRELLNELGTHISAITNISEDSTGSLYSSQDFVTLTAGLTNIKIINEKWDGETYNLKASLTANPNEVIESLNLLKRVADAEERARKAEEIAMRYLTLNKTEKSKTDNFNKLKPQDILKSQELLFDKLYEQFNKYESSNIVITAPESAETSSVVPVTLTANANQKGKFVLYASSNKQKLASVTEYLIPSDEYYYSTRIKMADSGYILAAFITDDGKVYASKKWVNVKDRGTKPSDISINPDSIYSKQIIGQLRGEKIRAIAKLEGEMGIIKLISYSDMSFTDHIQAVNIYVDKELAAISYLSPYVSMNPYFAIKYKSNANTILAVAKTNKDKIFRVTAYVKK